MLIGKEMYKMARFDGRGPRGEGPMTGRAMGYCAEDMVDRPFYCRGMGRGMRRFSGQGRGMRRAGGNGFYGRGMGRYYVDEASYRADSKDLLEDEKAALEARLKLINSELENTEE